MLFNVIAFKNICLNDGSIYPSKQFDLYENEKNSINVTKSNAASLWNVYIK